MFLPSRRTVLTQSVEGRDRTALFARYSLTRTLAGALGILAAALPYALSHGFDIDLTAGVRCMFVLYGALAVLALFVLSALSPAVEAPTEISAAPLGPSKGCLIADGAVFDRLVRSGFFVPVAGSHCGCFNALPVRFDRGAILFLVSLCSAVSFLIAVPLAKRFDFINRWCLRICRRTFFLMLVPLAPNLPVAVGLLLARGLLSQMDVPTRTSYVMAGSRRQNDRQRPAQPPYRASLFCRGPVGVG